jgi:hypothetical protein
LSEAGWSNTTKPRTFTDRELQILALARALAPDLMPALAAVAMVSGHGAIVESFDLHWYVAKTGDRRRLPRVDPRAEERRREGWRQVLGFAMGIADVDDFRLPRMYVEESFWRQAHTGIAQKVHGLEGDGPHLVCVGPEVPMPTPLTQSEARELLTFTDSTLAYLCSFPVASVRQWAVTHTHLL